MELVSLIEALSDPCAYPFPIKTVETRQTHISVVFLAGAFAYKIRKPVDLGFLDFSTLDKRRHFSEEEIRLNSRLAPGVYLGVVPVARHGASLKLEGTGEVVEWAVKMERLPDDATLESHVECGLVGEDLMAILARKIATFHAQAERGPRISRFARFEIVATNARENFELSASQVGIALSRSVFEGLQILMEDVLSRHRALIEQRAESDVPRDTHGDLRLDHVYLFPKRSPPADMLVIDCIEFNEQFRFADPVADMAFLAMELKFHGRTDLASAFAESYFRTVGDTEGRTLLPLYMSYRAAVRGKVEGLKQNEPEVPPAQRALALAKARGYWLLSLAELEQPNNRPGLVLIGGLPGTGKSTLAAELANTAGFTVVRSDVVRKKLAGLSGRASTASAYRQGIYTPEWTKRTYAECMRQAEVLIFEGKRVIVDASFQDDAERLAFLQMAVRWCVPVTFLLCQADPQIVRQRLASRRGDASDADWNTFVVAAKSWQEPGPLCKAILRPIVTFGGPLKPLDQALSALGDLQLYE